MIKIRVAAFRGLLYWMEERQRIYLKRQAGEPWPWTEDPILQRYRFCNTYREQDKETVWLRENWLQPYRDHPYLWFACCLFRQINWSPTLDAIGFPAQGWQPEHVIAVMESRKKAGIKTYTSAYMLPEHGEKSKARYTVNRVLTPLWNAVEEGKECLPWTQKPNCTLEEAHRWLLSFYGFGAFLAYEAVTDWRHTRYLSNAPDTLTWANPGPGAKRGICRLLEISIKETIPAKEQLSYMQRIFEAVEERRDRSILPELEMRDIEHALCEYDKYCRVKDAMNAGVTFRGGLERFQRPLHALF
jgi:hypothetical protein